MDSGKPTLAIYGIQDRANYEFPFYVHDHNLALMQNGHVELFLQQERISRRKRDNTLHIHLKDILKQKKLLSQHFDLVFVDNVAGRAFISNTGDIRFEAPLGFSLAKGLEPGKCWWLDAEKKAYVLNHELAHIFSCLPFFGNFEENSLLVHFDGGASMSNFSAATFKNGKFEWVEYHWELKQYSAIFNSNALVFAILGAKLQEQNAVPGKLMGFAGWGKYDAAIESWLLENDLFQQMWGKTSLFLKKVKTDFNVELNTFDQKNPFIQNVAASLQHIFTQKVVEILASLAEKTGAENLYYTGGSALNIVANTAIINSGIFTNVFIPPCTEDSGLALGAAAFAEWIKHGSVEKHAPYLNNWNIEEYRTEYTSETIKKVAEVIVNGKVIGVCNGFGEAGPRALGNRSLLAMASSKQLARKLSCEMKGREWYRPVAPVALEKNTKYFTGLQKIHPLSAYMLLDLPVLPEKQAEIAGAVHADGTARFQTLFTRENNPFLFDLLTYLDKIHNIKALINTSFNAAGEPIVHTCDDALKSAQKMGIDGIVTNGVFTSLNN